MRTTIALLVATTTSTLAHAAPAASELAWLAGDWRRCRAGEIVEERWLGPHGGMLLGANLTSSGNGKTSFETLRIARSGDELVLWASPMGRGPVPFRLAESGTQRAVFANPAHGFPARIVYWRDGADLLARIEGTIRDERVSTEWRFAPGTPADCRQTQ